MDPAALAGRLEAIDDRLAATDAERRAAALVARELRAAGRRPRIATLWIRPRRDLVRALYAAVGVAGSVVAAGNAPVGLGLAAGALAALLLESAGIPALSLLQTRRATQNVVAARAGAAAGRTLLVLTASADVPRDSVLARLERKLPWRLLPGAPGLLVLALAGVAGCAGARLAGADGTVIGVVQLVPSAVLILLLGGFADAATARPRSDASAAGPAAAVAVAAALDARPPRALTTEVVVSGAGAAGAAGMAAYVRERRREVAPEDVVVVHLASGRGPIRYATHAGEHVPIRLHPRLVQLAAALPGAKPAVDRARTPARVARGARWPAITLEGEPRALAAAALRLVLAVDAELSR